MPDLTSSAAAGRPYPSWAVAVLSAPFTAQAWREAAYCLLGSLVGMAGAVLLVLVLAFGLGLVLSLLGAVLGLLLVVAGLALARGLGSVHRRLAGWLLGQRIPAPPALRTRPGVGLFGRLDARLRDGTGWRQVGYVLAKLPVAVFGVVVVLLWRVGLVNLVAPIRWAAGRHPHALELPTPLPFGGSATVHSFGGSFLGMLLGALTLLVAPWFTRALVGTDLWLMRALLGPGALAERVRDLEETRALAVDDSAALLRRLERDLHDGAQVRLVAVALSLDMIKSKLAAAPPVDLGAVLRLVEAAHENATQAIVELRDLARGIHPPVLDNGLADALATLTARSTVPVQLTVDVAERPSPALETIAYFCAAELLANVIKHSGAASATVSAVRRADGTLRLCVGDDGRGGAQVGLGSGLPGLVQRVRTVDGTLGIRSPEGGPTLVTVDLPPRA